MKRRLMPALSIGIAVILIGGLAYAADRRKNAKSVDKNIDPVHEEELLTAELLNAVENYEQKPHNPEDTAKVDGKKSSDNKEQTTSLK